MSLVSDIACITGGILLGIETLDKWDGGNDFFKKAENFLLPYNTIIGGVLLITSIFNVMRPGCLLFDIVGIAAGLLLFTGTLSKIPAIGDILIKASKSLLPFKAIIGVAILIIGVASLTGFLSRFC